MVSRVSRCGGGTDLEDIGDGDGVLGDLALGRDDGDGWPRHGGCCELTWWLVVAKKRSRRIFAMFSSESEFRVGTLYRFGA